MTADGRGHPLRRVLRRLDDVVLGDRLIDDAAGLRYGYGGRAGLKAEQVERQVLALEARVRALEARLEEQSR